MLATVDKPLLSYLRQELGGDAAIDCIKSALSDSDQPSNVGIIDLAEQDQLNAVSQLDAKSKLNRFLKVLIQELETGREECHGIQYQKENKKLKQSGGYALRYRNPITRFSGKSQGKAISVPVLAIDADLNSIIHREFFPDSEIYQITTARNCHVVQCYSTKNSKTSLTLDKGATDRIAQIQELVSNIAKDKNILVLGPQDITGNPKTSLVPKILVPDGSALAHFGNIRGIDSHKDKDEIVVIGQNNPPVNGIEAVARALWFDAEEPLKLGAAALVNEPRGYRTRSGLKIGVNVAVHPDQRVQTLLELTREAETLQGIDRLRLVHVAEAKLVVLLSNLVLDVTVDNLWDWDEITNFTTKLNEVWRQLNGVLPLADHWLAEHFPNIFVSKDAAGGYLAKIGNQLGELSNSILIRDSTQLRVFSYKVSGQTGPAPRCLSECGIDETKKRLELLLGLVVTGIELVE
jgi:hypothetical protein